MIGVRVVAGHATLGGCIGYGTVTAKFSWKTLQPVTTATPTQNKFSCQLAQNT